MGDGNKRQLDFAKNKLRVFDQMASMHFKISDEYKAKYTIEDVAEIICSVVLCGLTFFDFDTYLPNLKLNTTLVFGFVSIFLFAFTLIKQALGHKQLCEKHKLAGKMYVKAKFDLKSKIAQWEAQQEISEDIVDFVNTNFTALEDLPQIPEKKFARLKYKHQSKVAFSKFLDAHPNDFWFICKLKFRFTGKKEN